MTLEYRPEIDGLRALAVMPVVLFHAGVPGFAGGFVGVDVFFVISGYLITGILHREIRQGRYSLARFYERRIRRIVPALVVVLAATALAAPVLLLPSQLDTLPVQMLGTLGFVANIVFWSQAGYFGPEATEMPLLHMWSLGVEEQFYIVFPLLLAATCRRWPSGLPWVVGSVLLASLAASVLLTPTRPDTAFYLLPTRAWELMAGAGLALGYGPRVGRPALRSLLAWAGIAGIVAGVLLLDETQPFPGILALAPVGGAALVIACAPGTGVARLLSWGPMVAIGLVSYSLYLWHWPLIVFARAAGLADGLPGRAGAVAASLLLATLSWRLVERPFRRDAVVPRAALLACASTAAAALAGVAVAFWVLGPSASLASSRAVAFDGARLDFSPIRDRCHANDGLPPPEASCILGEGPVALAVWGDSMGVELADALSRDRTVQVITYSACPPALGLEVTPRPLCREHNDQVLDYLRSRPDIPVVLLAAKHTILIGAPGYGEALRRTVDELRATGRTVLVLGAMPIIGRDVPTWLARGHLPDVPRAATALGDARIGRLLASLDGAVVIDPAEAFCGAETCSLLLGDRPVFFDDHHPSAAAARALADRVGCALGDAGAPPSACPAPAG